MKEYPSILNCKGNNFQEFRGFVFDKIDGSNLRFEWSRKNGWYKFGTRTRLFDVSDPDFGVAIPIFHNTLAEKLEKIAKDNKWERIIAFTEFWGPNSFAGKHDPQDEKKLTLIDVNVHKKGIISARDFLKLFSHLEIPNYLGQVNWTRGFVERVRNGEIADITFEGVVGKAGDGHHIIMRKAKTQAWIDKVMAQYGVEEGTKIIES